MNLPELRARIEALAARERPALEEVEAAVEELLRALEAGLVRAATREGGTWRLHPWVKQGLLLGFRFAPDVSVTLPPVFFFRDRAWFSPRDVAREAPGVRVVPGGTTVRRGAFVGPGAVVMPPAYVNVGAWVGPRAMVDSHALVGSCAQVEEGVHLSAGAQLGGVLEPPGAWPVIVEEGAFVGGGCGVFEGTRVGRRAVLAPGVMLTASLPLFDLVRQQVYRASQGQPLVVPEGAVVVPGTRRLSASFAEAEGLGLYAPVIVKYRDARTDAAAALEEALR